jgi:hypothetical protein
MTRNEHIYAIQNIINSGPMSDDNRFSNRLVHHFLKVARALLLKRKVDKYQIDVENYQTICMPLCVTKFHDCDCLPNLHCQILRSKYKLPQSISSRWGSILKVSYFDGRTIGYQPLNSQTYSQYSRVASTQNKSIGWFIHNDYLYITNTLDLKAVLISGLFEEPEDVQDYSLCDSSGNESDDACYNPETDSFPIDADLVMPMYEMVLNMMGVAAKYPEDNENNARSVQLGNDKE